MMHVLVTGGSGFIGQHLVTALHARGLRVRILDIRSPGALPSDIQYVQGSVLDPAAVEQALAGISQVYHLAGLPGMWTANKHDFHDVNCRGTEAILAAAQKCGVSRFLHCSTESILFGYSDMGGRRAEETLQPAEVMPGPYTRSKALAEQCAMQAAASGFPVIVGTPTMPIGPADHNLTPPTAMLRHFLNRRLQLYVDFLVNLVDVRDVALGLILAMERGRVGQRYILGGESIRLGAILRMMTAMSARRQYPIAVPGRIAEATATMLELVADRLTRRPPSGTPEGVRIALRASDLSIEKSRTELGYAPRPIEPVLRETIAHLLALDAKGAPASLERRALSSGSRAS
jgi:dihydroflavonol-4-reductase